MPEPPLNIAVLVPTGGVCRTFFVHSLLALFMHQDHLRERPEVSDLRLTLMLAEMSVIHDNREILVRRALDWGATHVLFLDDDMVFPPDILSQLLGRRLPFVACNYPQRRAPLRFTALDADASAVLVTDADSTGVVPGSLAGLGVALIAREVLEAVPEPRFLPGWDTEKNGYIGEDFAFCDAARAAGFPVWIDQDASRRIGHLGAMLYTWQSDAPAQPAPPGMGGH